MRAYANWFDDLAVEEQDAIIAVTLRLQVDGPALRRPLSGKIKSDDWTEWCDTNMAIADAIYERHLESEGLASKNRSSRKPGGRTR